MQTQKGANFFTVNQNDIQAFFGIFIAMGLCVLPRLHDYWQEGMFSIPWLKLVMSRNRFYEILRYFHVNDNSKRPNRGQPGYKLFHVAPMVEVVKNTFTKYHTPERSLSVNEQMLGTKWQISFLQYMLKKPKKIGIKIWVLAKAVTGFCLNFSIYTGAEQDNTWKRAWFVLQVCTLSLMENFLHKGHVVYFDNFFSSVLLLNDLLEKGTLASGTVRANRKLGKDKLKKGKTRFWSTGKIMAVHWKDKRDVLALSSEKGNSVSLIQPRKDEQDPVLKPDIIVSYNKNMGAVDLCSVFHTTQCKEKV